MFFWRLSFLLCFSSFIACSGHPKEERKTVLLAILARDKAHCLPYYLECIERLDYNKKLISVYVNTNNNQDDTKEILQAWIEKNKDQYRSIVFENNEISDFDTVNPHQWNSKMFRILGTIRNQSLRKTKEQQCDFYFVVDCDNFIAPSTLKVLVEKDKPIVAPMLRSIPHPMDPYSNYFCDITPKGYYRDHPDYHRILYRVSIGTFKVPVVHCTYLIKAEYLDPLSYTDETYDYEFVVFSREARKHKIDQYICNEEEFGVLVHSCSDKVTLAEEKGIVDQYFSSREGMEFPARRLRRDEECENVFSHIYEEGLWGKDADGNGTSGPGSLVEEADPYLSYLQNFLEANQIKSVVDVGCGDWTFSQHINWDGIDYTGIDVVESVIEKNKDTIQSPNVRFVHADLLNTELPPAEMVIFKDVLQHLPNEDVAKILHQLSQYQYCLITNCVDPGTYTSRNQNIPRGWYRSIDLTQHPFNVTGTKVLTYRSGNFMKQVLLVSNQKGVEVTLAKR